MLADHKGSTRIVAGNTGTGVYKDWPSEPVLVSIAQVRALCLGVLGVLFVVY